MPVSPTITERPAQHYLAIPLALPASELETTGVAAMQEVIAWAAEHSIEHGAPFFKYTVIDMDGIMQMEFGVPVTGHVSGEGRIAAGTLPAGRYLVTTHTGHYDGLYATTGEIVRWAEENDVVWDSEPAGAGERFAARLENYLTDPASLPPAEWRTEIAIKLAD